MRNPEAPSCCRESWLSTLSTLGTLENHLRQLLSLAAEGLGVAIRWSSLKERKNRKCRIFVHSKEVFLENPKSIGIVKGCSSFLCVTSEEKMSLGVIGTKQSMLTPKGSEIWKCGL